MYKRTYSGIYFRGWRGKYVVHPMLLGQRKIPLLVARVLFVIFSLSKLEWVDEDPDTQGGVPLSGLRHQMQVTLVKCAHRWYETKVASSESCHFLSVSNNPQNVCSSVGNDWLRTSCAYCRIAPEKILEPSANRFACLNSVS